MVSNTGFSPGAGLAGIARGLSRATGTEIDGETLKATVVFCGIGLVVALLLATNALDTGIGFF